MFEQVLSKLKTDYIWYANFYFTRQSHITN